MTNCYITEKNGLKDANKENAALLVNGLHEAVNFSVSFNKKSF